MTDWNRRYLQNDTPWDKGHVAPPLVEALENGLEFSGKILVPGCGLGHDARYVACRSPRATVLAVDISAEALCRAQEYENPQNLDFQQIDFLGAAWTGGFNVLVEHTLYCAINPSQRQAYAEAAAKAIKVGGLFLGIFFKNDYPDLEEGPPYFSSDAQLDACFDEHFELLEKWLPGVAFEERVGEEELRLYRRQ